MPRAKKTTIPRIAKLLTVQQAARQLKLPETQVTWAIEEGRLLAFNIASSSNAVRHYRILPTSVAAYSPKKPAPAVLPENLWSEPLKWSSACPRQPRKYPARPFRPVLKVASVAGRLACTRGHVANLVADGSLSALNLAGAHSGGKMCLRIPPESLREFLIKRCNVEVKSA